MKLKKKNYKYAGFTLVELLVSISIIGLISGLFFANYRSTARQNVLTGAVQQLSGTLRLVQSYASGARKNNGFVPRGGWGVYFSALSNSYNIFTDDNADNKYTTSPAELYQKVDLPANILISGIEVTKWNAMPVVGTSTVSVVFLPPDPKTYITTNLSTDNTENILKITLKDNINKTTKTVLINFFGLIDVQ